MNNTEPKGKLAFAYKTIARLEEQKSRLLTAANVSSVDEVVALLERKRDHQGFLINTDVDDTMSKPLSDEDIEDEAEKYARPLAEDHKHRIHWDGIKNYWKEGFRKAVELHANRPQAGWIDVKDRLPEQPCFVIACKRNGKVLGLYFNADKEFKYAETDQTYQVTHWQPLPPKPKQ